MNKSAAIFIRMHIQNGSEAYKVLKFIMAFFLLGRTRE